METLSALLAICVGNSSVPGELPAQRPVTRSFDIFFDLCLNKRLSKQPWGWWFETPLWSLWRQCNDGDAHGLDAQRQWQCYSGGLPTLTLSQWSSSGNPVAIQCAWNLDPSVHWNATGEMPVCFQWSSSGFPVVLQCVPIMQINTGSPLGHHWVQASASVVPVASQCTCGSSGLAVCSNYAN